MQQLAYEYARRGACLVLAARRGKSLREVADMCLEIGSPDAVTVTADVSDVDDCKRIVDSAISHFGRLDHLVSNAGITSISMVEEYDDITEPRSVMDVNFWGSVYVTRFAIPHLRDTGGKIVAMSSSASWLPAPRMSIYNASKAALVALYETLRVEIGSDIHITIVTPGFIESEMTKGKHLTGKGQVKVDLDMRDVLVSVFPVGKAEVCAKAIVNSVCRSERYVTEPAWYRATYWWETFFPELNDRLLRLLYLTKFGESASDSLSKMFVDLPGFKAMVYPPSIRSPEIKTE